MSTNIERIHPTQLTMWDDPKNLAEIKSIFAPKLTDLEFSAFIEMGKATQLNPFLKEIWAVKYDERAVAQIFIGRDGYRKGAQAHPLYDYHLVEAVYTNDVFEVENGKIHHKYKMSDRGNLIAAYCIVQRKGSSHYTYSIVNLDEYSTGKSLWSTKKVTMLKKVAEAQALKAAFQERFAGTYHEAEEWEPDNSKPKRENASQHVNALLESEHQPITVDNIASLDVVDGFISNEQLDVIENLLHEKMFDDERIKKMLTHFNVDSLDVLSSQQADECIAWLNKVSRIGRSHDRIQRNLYRNRSAVNVAGKYKWRVT